MQQLFRVLRSFVPSDLRDPIDELGYGPGPNHDVAIDKQVKHRDGEYE